MLFNTWTFALFVAAAAVGLRVLRSTPFWLPWLTLCSFGFYAWFDPRALPVLLYVATAAYATAWLVRARPAAGRVWWFILGIVVTLAPLLFFKYGRFAVDNVNALAARCGLPVTMPDPSILLPRGMDFLLPIGLSFFTFQSIGYVIDCWLGKTAPERNPLRFAAFVSFFPVVTMGPIERAGHLLPQLRAWPAARLGDVTEGMSLLLLGLFKKAALADPMAVYVARVYDNPAGFDATALVLATVAFSWQLFFDFSGYTDMARGAARLMGIDLLENFNRPYLATGLADFWRRWHISFSRWLLDHLFMPLQLQWRHRGRLGTLLALTVTFLVCGIWHGAAWTFVLWGALHGGALALTHGLERSAFYRRRVPTLLKRVWVFAFVSLAWIFFRAASIDDALLIVRRIFTTAWGRIEIPGLIVGMMLVAWGYQAMRESRCRALLDRDWVRIPVAICMLLYLILAPSPGARFLYLQF